jgi:hypothetical protein
VLGVIHEPFIRIGPGGVFVSSRSPTAESAGLVTLQQMQAAHWIRVSGGHSFAWHENRPRPVPSVSGADRRVAGWSIPLLVDGRPVTLTGSEWYAAQPRRLLWAVPAVAALVVAAIVLATRRVRLIWMVAAIGLVLALVTWMAGWIGVLLDQRLSTSPLVVSVLYAISVVLVVAAAVTAPRRAPERLVAMGRWGSWWRRSRCRRWACSSGGSSSRRCRPQRPARVSRWRLVVSWAWRCWRGRRW